MKELLSGWGNYPRRWCDVYYPSTLESIRKVLRKRVIPRGSGRSYADQSLGERVIKTVYLKRFLKFDGEKGILWAESGVTFEDIIKVFLPKGWFPYVTPGTKFVSLGGALASDIHGKNHHKEGSISNFIIGFNIMLPSGEIIYCSRNENDDLFRATLGGMGLTGIIIDVKLKLRRVESSYIYMKTFRVKNIEEMFQVFTDNDPKYTYSVAWIDCLAGGKNLGRGVVMFGEHAKYNDLPHRLKNDPLRISSKRRIKIPFYLPNFTLNRLSIGLFNEMYYFTHNSNEGFVDYERFFYPLDSILNWNRMYGKRGFVQYQFVVPEDDSMITILEKIVKLGRGSFLGVLKRMGRQEGYFTFGMEGWTLALDFPAEKEILDFLRGLNNDVMELGGRVYLTKDAILDETAFKEMYPQWKSWLEIKHRYDPTEALVSDFSKRVGISNVSY